MAERVWIDWGGGDPDQIQEYQFETLGQLNAFLEGVSAAACAWGIDDFFQLNNEEEVNKHRAAMEGEQEPE